MTLRAVLDVLRLAVDADAVARRSAEQLIDGHAERLALDVPHRDVHGRQRARQDDVAAVEGLAVDGLPVVCGLPRVLADQIRLELLDRGDDRRMRPSTVPSPMPTMPASVCILTKIVRSVLTGMISILVILIADRGSASARDEGAGACAPRTSRSLASTPVIPAVMFLNH